MTQHNKTLTRTMKKSALLFGLLLAAASCNKEAKTIEAKRALIEEKKEKITNLNIEIDSLKTQIAAMDTSAVKEEITPVKTKVLQPETFRHFVEITGTVASKQNLLLSAEVPGQIEEIKVKEGDRVRKGDVLIRQDNDAIKNQLDEAEAAYELAKTTFERRQKLWDQKIGSEIEFLQAKTNYKSAKKRLEQLRANYSNTFIKSPINGEVDVISVNEGEFAGAGTPVVRVVNLENPEIEAELSERYLPYIEKGDTVLVKIPALDQKQEVPVSFISQYINPENRSFMIKVDLENPDGKVLPNILANMVIQDYEAQNALVVPSFAIQKDLEGDYVYVVQKGKDGKPVAAKKYIETGRSSAGSTEITKGLKKGDEVVTSGFEQLNEGKAVSRQ